MRIIIFGATGMVGQGVLRECLLDSDVESVLVVGRTPVEQEHPKLRQVIRKELNDLSGLETELTGFDACFFCLGVSSAGMSEERYTSLTYDLTMSVAQPLASWNPRMVFIYVSGMGTDSTEKGRTMWARVKGRTENALLRMPFRAAYMFRPAVIVPMNGVRSKTGVYQFFYTITGPVLPLLYSAFPKYVTTTEQVGRAMIKVSRHGWPSRVLENSDINNV